jgi:hypothetical protein
MPITLNHSNISVQYSTGSNYIIETVKSDLYSRNKIYDSIVRDNLQTAPVTPSIYIENGTNNIYAVESYTYTGTANTADYTRVFTKSTTCDILVVGGGGGGGFAGSNARGGGGGGAGQFLLKTNYSFNAGTYNINVGRGGLGGNVTTENGETGKNTSISTSTNTILLESFGGGGGARGKSGTLSNGLNGASGGGGCGDDLTNRCLGGTALTQFVNNNTLYTGYNGANGGPVFNGGGGGGYTSAGYSSTNTNGGDGGSGITNSITGIVNYYCAGGGGGAYNNGVSVGTRGGNGGNISAGNGGNYPGANGGNATNGSGGGGAGVSVPGGSVYVGGNGGSGIVIIRYLLGTIPSNNLLTTEPTVSPSITSDMVFESYTYTTGTDNTTYTKVFSQSTVCDIMIVAGGGGGGSNAGAGGGAGGLLLLENLTVSAGSYQITVGRGGAGGTSTLPNTFGEDGKNSTFGSYTAIGGGGGANSGGANGRPGGSGGGTGDDTTGTRIGGAGTAGQGNKGGDGTVSGGTNRTGGGGGGAGAAGQNSVSSTQAGNGGVGRNMSSYFGTTFGASGWFAGGGGGGVHSGTGGTGGTGGGGNENTEGVNGTGGGGGAGRSSMAAVIPDGAKKGGSGIVIIRYRSLAQPPVSINMNKTLNFNYYPTLSPTTYTLNFPVPTIADINNNSNIVLRGAYDIALSTSNAVIIPKAGQYIPKPTTFTNYAIERMYPPVRNFTAATTAVSGQTYGNGTYVVSYSSTLGGGHDPWTCFNTTSTIGGHWGSSRYSSGTFNSTSFIVAGYLGDWVKIQLPVAIKLTRFNFVSRPTLQVRSPKDFKIYGSNDNITWVELVNKTDAVYNASSIYEQTTPEITNTYTYYGLVVNKIFTGTNDETLNFDEWYIYGQEPLTNSLSLRYHLLNPTLDPIGAQWTYSSNNTNVYHMGSVGIGTKSPEYQLDVRGFIFTSVGGYTQTGSENWVVQSDRRIKENIVKASYEKCLDNVKKIELYNFNFKDNCVNTNDKNQLGFIAQEVQQVYPKAVEVGRMTLDNNQGINDLLTLNTTQIKYTLYGAVKNLIERVENIESRVEQIYNMTLSSNIKSSSSNISITFITPLTPLTSNITANTSNITTNTSNITTNTSNITTNTSNITTNSSNITTNTSNITANSSNITTNTSNITTNTSNI